MDPFNLWNFRICLRLFSQNLTDFVNYNKPKKIFSKINEMFKKMVWDFLSYIFYKFFRKFLNIFFTKYM